MNTQLNLIANNVRTFLKTHHAILFISIVSLLLGVAVFSLYQVLSDALATPAGSNTTIQPFDQKTVDRIKRLHDSSDVGSETIILPSSRPNPFGE